MRPLWLVLLVLGPTLAGCTDAPAPEPPATNDARPDPADPASYVWAGVDLLYDDVSPRPLTVGTAWTYATEGRFVSGTNVTVVVAESGPQGALLAAASPDDLVDAAVWTPRFLGPMDASLERAEAERFFDWPLFDGKLWHTHGLAVTAVAQLVETPAGLLPGFEIRGADGTHFIEATYVPAIGYLTQYTHGRTDGTATYESFTLTAIGNATEAHWFERGARFGTAAQVAPPIGLPNETAALPDAPNATAAIAQVPDGYDHLLLVGRGVSPGEGGVQSLTGVGAWGFEGSGEWAWTIGRVPATAGPWLVTAHTGAGGWAEIHGVPVKWVHKAL